MKKFSKWVQRVIGQEEWSYEKMILDRNTQSQKKKKWRWAIAIMIVIVLTVGALAFDAMQQFSR